MKILILMPWLTGGGAERQLAHLSIELQRRGHRVLVGFIYRGPGQWPNEVPVHAFTSRRSWSPLLIEDMVRLIRTWKPDVIQTCLTRMDVCGAAASRRTGIPFILREPNSAEAYPRGLKSWLRRMSGRSSGSTTMIWLVMIARNVAVP